MLNFTVQEDRCIQCGKCVADCPPKCIAMDKGEYPTIPEEKQCIQCQHCLAICPTGAISIMGANPDNSLELKYGMPTAHSMETLIKGRRSVRTYKKNALEPDTIRHLLNTSWHAPTGTNAQGVLFTATMTREATEALGKELYTKLGTMLADQDPARDELSHKYMRMAYGAYSKHGVDVVLRGAPHVVIASAPKSIPLPKEDCLIALSTFDLLAQTIGVGTVWNGMFTWCVADFFPELATRLGVPADHTIGYCMSFGRPAVEYYRTVQRTPPAMNLVDSF